MACHLMAGLDKRRFRVAAISMFDSVNTELEKLLMKTRIRTWYLGKRLGPDLRMYSRIYRVLRHFRPHVVHTHRYVLSYALPAMLSAHIPVKVHTVHSLAEGEVGTAGRLLHHLAFRCGVIPVAIAHEVLVSLLRLYGRNDYTLIPNGIPVHFYSNPKLDRGEWRKREGFMPEDVLFTCVARLDPPKNQPLLVEAFSSGPAADPKARLLLVGSGGWKTKLEMQIRALGMQEQILLLGHRTDIPELLSATDVFVLPSSREGNPLSVMEAMAAGNPVISTIIGGVPELVEDGVSGLLVPPTDTNLLIRAMNELLKNELKRKKMGAHAARRAAKRFDVKVMVRAYEELYERALKSP